MKARRAHQLLHGEVEDEDWPAPGYLNARISETEEGELVAETLTRVRSCKEGTDEDSAAYLDNKGKVVLVQGKKEVPLPKNP